MRFVHFGHSCVLVDTGAGRLLIDPGAYSSGFEELRDLDAILITHQHPDHVNFGALPALVAANPNAELVVDEGTAARFGNQEKLADVRHRTARPGETLHLAGVDVHVVGGEHAVIHPDVPRVPNVGYLLGDGAFLHPGDSFFVPDQRVDVLAVPVAAPWLKAAEAVEYVRAVTPRIAVPIHEAVLTRPQMHYDLLTKLAPEGTEIQVLPRGEETDL